jgi:hypothetical protein
LQHFNHSISSYHKATSVCPIGHLDVALMKSNGGALSVELHLLELDEGDGRRLADGLLPGMPKAFLSTDPNS